jgi:hypothetical protein
MNKPHVWSHTSLACWETCPRQFYHRYVAKDAVFESSPAAARGTLVHGAMEARLRYKAPLPEDMPYEKLAASLDGKPMVVEAPLGIQDDGGACDWWGPGVAGRGKPDVVILSDETACILDWKTGKIREDPTELETFAVLIHAHFPEIKKFTGYYIWLANGTASTVSTIGSKYTLDWRKRWQTILKTSAEIGRAIQSLNGAAHGTLNPIRPRGGCASVPEGLERFPPTPNGLCQKWCNALKCPHNGKR